MSKITFLDAAPVGRIFLLLSNPRHEPFSSEAKAIEYLCEKEQVHALARDIVKFGLNPLERFAVIPVDRKKVSGPASYYVAEGNRRLCALKLLNDPELAPSSLRKSFEKLSENWKPVSKVSAVLFDGIDSVKIWLDRIHNGAQGGIGRREWNAEQKQRSNGGNKNRAAQALLDYAQSEKLITPEEREGKLTTVQRFLVNDVFREMLGLDQANPAEVTRSRPKEQFDLLLKRFMRDLVGKDKVNSRMNKEAIIQYARPLSGLPGINNSRIEPEALPNEGKTKIAKATPKGKPKKPEKARHVQYEDAIFQALRAYGNGKLESLYHSICSIELESHTPLVAVGTWSFFETLTACAGRNENNSFDSYLSKGRLSTYGITGETLSIRNAIERIREYGNTTKHHPVSAIFNGDQLNNDMQLLKDVILKVIDEAQTRVS